MKLDRTKLYDTIAHANKVQAEEIERLKVKLRYVCAQLTIITGDKEGSPIEAYARSAVKIHERLRAERDEMLKSVNEDTGYESLKRDNERLRAALARAEPVLADCWSPYNGTNIKFEDEWLTERDATLKQAREALRSAVDNPPADGKPSLTAGV